jgi:hypothetical protein
MLTAMLAGWLAVCGVVGARLEPIEGVGIDGNRAITVNGRAFFPIMIWLQGPENFALARSAGINTAAGYWPGSGGTKDAAEYLSLVEEAGFYGVLPFDERLKGHRSLLGYIHGDEPDLPGLASDTEIVASSQLRINNSTPLWKIFDGVTHSWSVLDPLEGAAFTLKLDRPVEVQRLGVWLTISGDLSVAREVSFKADGKEIATATLKNQKGRQDVVLEAPVTLRELSVAVNSTYAGGQAWGSVGEIEGFDGEGRNVLLSAPRQVPRTEPSKVLDHYVAIKAADSSRPVFMTLTGHFLPFFKKWSDEQRTALYPAYIRAADVVGYDIYPIYGWNKPEWLGLVHDGTKELCRLAGKRPVYAWIETSRGGQWTGALENQKPVRPEHIRAEVWMAICRGATAIGYFTHIWKPEYKQFGVPPENVRAMRQINEQISGLAPVILSGDADVKANIRIDGGLSADIMARNHGGYLYLFAISYDPRQTAGGAVIEVEGLERGAKIDVVDENRTLEAADGTFTDEFGPLDVHIYRIAR